MRELVKRLVVLVLLLAGAAGWAGCPAEDPEATPGGGAGSGGGSGGSGGGGAGSGGAACDALAEDVSGCSPAAGDYRPRDPAANDAPADPFAACISDDDAYHPVDPNVSTIARTASFEELAPLLWDNPGVPSVGDFTAAREIYVRDQGLDSRLQRRFDPHYPAPATGGCGDAGVPEANPDYCVGPARLVPVLNEAFAAGQTGTEPVVQAARIEAALSWFLFVSAYKETQTCLEAPRDCDSAWAYYSGGLQRGETLGISRDVDAAGPATHDRVFDALLGIRCWRGLEGDATVTGYTHLDLHAAASAQLDRALNRGAALVARSRLQELECSTGSDRDAAFAFLRTLLPLLDRATREQGAAHADALAVVASASSSGAAASLAPAAIDALDAAFPCP